MQELQKKLDSLLDYRGAAEVLAVSVPTVKRLASSGEIPVIRVGQRATRFEPSALREFIDSRRGDAQKAQRTGA